MTFRPTSAAHADVSPRKHRSTAAPPNCASASKSQRARLRTRSPTRLGRCPARAATRSWSKYKVGDAGIPVCPAARADLRKAMRLAGLGVRRLLSQFTEQASRESALATGAIEPDAEERASQPAPLQRTAPLAVEIEGRIVGTGANANDAVARGNVGEARPQSWA